MKWTSVFSSGPLAHVAGVEVFRIKSQFDDFAAGDGNVGKGVFGAVVTVR